MNRPEFSEAVHEASENLAVDVSLTPLERVQATTLREIVDRLKHLPRVHPPPEFAAQLASEIALAQSLETARVRAPADFAASLSMRIRTDSLGFPVRAPEHFAQTVSARIAEDAESFPILESLPRVVAPVSFAVNVALSISADASSLPALALLPRVSAPPNFAHNLALRIALDADPELNEQEAHDRAPLYFIGALLTGVAVALVALTWQYASVAGQALFETLRLLPESILLPVLGVAVLASLGVLTTRRVRLPAALAAFGVAAVAVVPQALPFFGSAQVSGSAQLGSIVRFAGDINVSGEVRGDVIAVGGNVRLAPGARVSGRVLTFLGDVNLPENSTANGGVSAVLGKLNADAGLDSKAQSASLPGLSAASALQPFRALVTAGTWQWWYFAFLVSLGGALLLLPHLRHALEKSWQLEAGRSIGLGVLLLFLTVPAVALGGLSLIGAPFALLIGVFTLLAFSSGAALTLTKFGSLTLRAFGVHKPGLWRLLPGFLLFGASLFYAPLGITLWLLLGAWGAGALLIALRQGAFVSSLES